MAKQAKKESEVKEEKFKLNPKFVEFLRDAGRFITVVFLLGNTYLNLSHYISGVQYLAEAAAGSILLVCILLLLKKI